LSKNFFKKGNFYIKMSQEKKFQKKFQNFKKLAKIKFTLREEKIQSNLH